MPGPPPKDPALRQRRNRSSTAAKLPADGGCAKAPTLPKRDDGMPWHGRAVKRWAELWASPMAARWLDAEAYDVWLIVDTVHDLHSIDDHEWASEKDRLAAKTTLKAEIARLSQRLGITALDRRRLGWTIEDEPQPRPAGRGQRPASPRKGRQPDRRSLLYAVDE